MRMAEGYEHDPAYADPLEVERREAHYDQLRTVNGWVAPIEENK